LPTSKSPSESKKIDNINEESTVKQPLRKETNEDYEFKGKTTDVNGKRRSIDQNSLVTRRGDPHLNIVSIDRE